MSDLKQRLSAVEADDTEEAMNLSENTLMYNMELLLRMVKETGDKSMIKLCEKCFNKIDQFLLNMRTIQDWFKSGAVLMRSCHKPGFLFELGKWWGTKPGYALFTKYE